MTKNQSSFVLIAFVLFSLMIAPAAQAQRLVAQVSLNTEKLLQESKDKLAPLQDQLVRYINDYDWSGVSSGYEIPVQVDVYFERADPASFEDRYDARLVVSNQSDFQESDKRWRFAYQQGAQLNHAGQFNSLTSALDFYFYILLGQQFDKSTKLGGTPYYQKAYQVAQLSKFSEFFQWGWQERLTRIEKLQSDAQIPLRELNYFFVQGRNRLRVDDRKTAEQYLRVVVLRLHHLNPEDESTQRFYELNSFELGRMLTTLGLRQQLQDLSAMDPAHQATYDAFFKQMGP